MLQKILGPVLGKLDSVSPRIATEIIRKAYGRIVPYARHSHVTLERIDPGYAVATMPDHRDLRNHIGSQHAAALYALAESASGGAMIGVFGSQILTVRPVAATASIEYKKVARGPITAEARTDRSPDDILGELEREGVVRFDVDVTLRDQKEREVCAVRVEWHVRGGK